jgi:Uma2 family endonuclease
MGSQETNMAIHSPIYDKKYRPRRRGWTRQEYERATEVGLFGPEERLELIEGEVICKMPMNSPHATALRRCERRLTLVFAEGFDVRGQLPIALDDHNEPEPDVAVVVGSPDDYAQEHPTTAVLIVEISDTTLAYDRGRKAGLYARAGIADYWIVNLVERFLEVHRQPAAMRGRPLGHGYQSILRLDATQTVTPLAALHTNIAVTDLLPPA